MARSYIELLLMYSNGDVFMVARVDDIVRGYLIAKHTKNNSLHILSVGIDVNYRSKGVGTMLLNYFAAETGASIITLYVHIENDAAIKFYEKNGFAQTQTMKNYYGGALKATSQDAYKMTKKIEKPTIWVISRYYSIYSNWCPEIAPIAMKSTRHQVWLTRI